jgi:hypothetical protein
MATIYNVHIYREMRLVFGGIEADTPEAAASNARDKETEEADSIDDCDGETLAALVDLVGDEEYEQSRFIDFEPERQRKAAPKLWAALETIERAFSSISNTQEGTQAIITLFGRHDGSINEALTWRRAARAVLAEAEAAGILLEPAASAERNQD